MCSMHMFSSLYHLPVSACCVASQEKLTEAAWTLRRTGEGASIRINGNGTRQRPGAHQAARPWRSTLRGRVSYDDLQSERKVKTSQSFSGSLEDLHLS